VDYAIPSNDDASKAISFITNYLVAAIREGLDERKSMKGDEETVSTTTTAATTAA
jgi:small subunit ribosomal protein S2